MDILLLKHNEAKEKMMAELQHFEQTLLYVMGRSKEECPWINGVLRNQTELMVYASNHFAINSKILLWSINMEE